jgi:hypothetical protein
MYELLRLTSGSCYESLEPSLKTAAVMKTKLLTVLQV